MVQPPCQPCALDPERDQGQPRSQDASFEPPRAELVDTDPMLLGMRMGNLIYAAVFGLLRSDERQ